MHMPRHVTRLLCVSQCALIIPQAGLQHMQHQAQHSMRTECYELGSLYGARMSVQLSTY